LSSWPPRNPYLVSGAEKDNPGQSKKDIKEAEAEEGSSTRRGASSSIKERYSGTGQNSRGIDSKKISEVKKKGKGRSPDLRQPPMGGSSCRTVAARKNNSLSKKARPFTKKKRKVEEENSASQSSRIRVHIPKGKQLGDSSLLDHGVEAGVERPGGATKKGNKQKNKKGYVDQEPLRGTV